MPIGMRLLRVFLASGACLIVLHGTLFSQTNARTSPDDVGRPILKHQSAPMQDYGVPDNTDDTIVRNTIAAKVEVAPGLNLPSAGHVWVLDNFAGQPQLVQLKYTMVVANNHVASNTVKVNLAPFVYKPKVTFEIPGSAALVRIHDAMPAIFFVLGNEDAADPTEAAKWGNFALVRLRVGDGKRVVSTTAFTQFTAKAKRSEEQVEALIERVGNVGWYKIFPKQPLLPGEYAFVRLPKQATMLGASIFDFAIDPEAPQNTNVTLGDSAKKN